MTKVASRMAEDAKVSTRNVRRDANDTCRKMQKDSVISEDEREQVLEKIQKITDSTIEKIDSIYKAKEAEVMGE
jgi:ribosome recycling factor